MLVTRDYQLNSGPFSVLANGPWNSGDLYHNGVGIMVRLYVEALPAAQTIGIQIYTRDDLGNLFLLGGSSLVTVQGSYLTYFCYPAVFNSGGEGNNQYISSTGLPVCARFQISLVFGNNSGAKPVTVCLSWADLM
jgi:hypothetical protein